MTPQAQYKKFYDKPHLWINAIEVECVNPISTVNLFSQERRHFNFGETYSLAENYSFIKNNIDCFAPKFKPQEGEQFVKDLETAVSAATGIEFVYKDIDKGKHRLYSKDFGYVVKLPIININLVRAYQTETGMAISYFDTAAYVDKMRELGYYFVK